MTIERLTVGSLGTNCYVVGDEKEALVVDPGGDFETIKSSLRSRRLVYILLTHAHIDHIGALDKLKDAYPEAKVALHSKELSYLKNSSENLSHFMGNPYIYNGPVEIELKEGMKIPFLGKDILVFHTPGHTPGGCCFLIDGNLLSGDTLFRMSIGRTDFPGGSYDEIISSIKEKILPLGDEIKVYPGHMSETNIGYERKNNQFLN